MSTNADVSNLVVTDVEKFHDVAFDYLIIGAGAAGLTLANRLSDTPSVKVGVIEAGPFITNDPIIDSPKFIGAASNNPKYDWVLETVPQPNAGGRTAPAPRGKMLGGSTSINYIAWDRASKGEYDSWKQVADPEGAWGWDTLLPYFKRSENAAPSLETPDLYPGFSLSDKHVIHEGVPEEEAVGTAGPVKICYNTITTENIPPFIKAWNTIGIPTNANPYGGNATGVYNVKRTFDNQTGKRVDAVAAYLAPITSRNNLKIICGAQATKIIFQDGRDGAGNVVATGVEFVVDGKTHSAQASTEVLLCAGVVQTPQLLELSGIGGKALLAQHDIESLVDLPGVGENLMDHLFAPTQYETKPELKTFDIFRNNPEFAAEQDALYESTKQGWVAANDTTVVYYPLNKVVESSKFAELIQELEQSVAKESPNLTPLQRKQFEIQLEWLKKGENATLETLVFSRGLVNPQEGSSYFMVMAGLQHPFSRGSIHINSADPLKPPVIDPKYLSHPFDVKALVAGYRSTEKIALTQPLKEIIVKQVLPPGAIEKDEHLAGFITQAAASGSHLMGTAALARRDLGGVVGNDLRVYGTRNLRVVDGSLIPVPIACHIQATIYAIAERAADLIKKDHSGARQ
ncbi:alcohol oxidase [Rickenella mellea]|uniref:Alcohol oxidase n=1 Tax=Rickenella mellea TaxID=50990 RepID=A0A4Y7PTQ9_9AGAM|nr:alcohol oxidase [Rickenella mellea]